MADQATSGTKTPTGAWPRRVTLLYSLWMAFWVPVILVFYGPANFLWMCNIAKFFILIGLWTRNRLLVSVPAGMLVVVGAFWTSDFLVGLISGGAWAQFTGFMFNPDLPLLGRLTSLYHIVLPPVLLWVLRHVGYDRRAPRVMTAIAIPALAATWLWTDPERNINWMAAPMGVEQVWLPDTAFLAVMMVLYPLLLFWPGHGLVVGILRRWPADGATRR